MEVDLLSMGRANLDLYAQDVGADFADITGFDAMVGGSPTNIAIGAARLGCRAAVLTAVGDDLVGDFVVRQLSVEGVDVSAIRRVEGKLTSLALLGVQPPDRFPLAFYRDDPADIHLTMADVDAISLQGVRAVQVSGNAFSRGSCSDAARHLLATARANGIATYVDLDLRPTEWFDPGAYGKAIRAAAADSDVLIGTEDELAAALLPSWPPVPTPATSTIDLPSHLASAVASCSESTGATIVVKRGPQGATAVAPEGAVHVPGFPVEVVNTVGAGDAFAAGVIRMRLLGHGWHDSLRFGNASGAIVVTRHGCSKAFPTEEEVMQFLETRGAP